MNCPKCEEGQEMDELFRYASDEKRMEVNFECPNPQCDCAFYGILYMTQKPEDTSDEVEDP